MILESIRPNTVIQERRARDLISAWVFGAPVLDEIAQLPPQSVLPVVCRYHLEAHLLASCTVADLPGDQAAELRLGLQRRCLLNAARNLERDRRARHLCRALIAQDIPVMLLKGSVIRARYPELAGRPQCDTDLMVKDVDVARAEQVILDNGYHLDESSSSREHYLAEHFHLKFLQDHYAVELHWTMSNECAPGAVARVWERAEDLRWGDVTVKIPNLADQIVFHHVHISRHLFMGALRWYADLFFELDRWPDLEAYPESVLADWPARYLLAPAWVAGREGWELPGWAMRMSARESTTSRWLLGSIGVWHLRRSDWHRIPTWCYVPGLRGWMEGDRRNLPMAFVGSVLSQVARRPLVALGLVHRTAELDRSGS